MRNVLIATMLVLLGAGAVGGLSGCREESADMSLRRARLIGNENIELKKQLKQRDEEIQRQKQLVQQCLADREKDKAAIDSTMLKMLKQLADLSKQVEELTATNTQLKEKIKQLQGSGDSGKQQ